MRSPADRGTDWKRLRSLTPAQIRAAIGSDPDIRPTDAAFWRGARVVMPRGKEAVTLKLDADLLAWFRRQRGFERKVNAVLRAYMAAASARPGRARRTSG